MSVASRRRLAELLDAPAIDLAEANLMIACEADQWIDLDTALATVEGLATAAREDGVVPALRQASLFAAQEIDLRFSSIDHSVG